MTVAAKKYANAGILPALLTEENHLQRWRLRRNLGLIEALREREAFRVGGIHCELYKAADSKAPVVIFLCGIGTYSELYARLLTELSRNGFNVVSVDLRGHGYSDGERGELRVSGVAQDVSLVIDALQTRFSGPVCVYGYSIGATLAASVAARDERVVALACGTLLLPEVPPDLLHLFGWSWTWMSAMWMPGLRVPLQQFLEFDALLAETDAPDDLLHDPLLVQSYSLQTLSSLFNTHTGLMSLNRKLPVCVLHGDKDIVLPLEYSRRLQRQSKLEMSLVVVKGQGHMMPWDAPELAAHVVADWFHTALVGQAVNK